MADDERLRDALGAGGAHVVLGQHLEDARARHPHDHRAQGQAQREARQQELLQRLHRLHPEQDEALRGKPVEIERRDEDQEDAEPEARDGQHEQDEHADPHRRGAAAADGGEDAERETGGQRDEQRDRRELERDGEGGHDLGQDGPPRHERAAEIPSQRLPQPLRVPHRQGPVDPEEPAHLGEPRRIARLLAHQDVDDVARDQIEEQERQHRDAEEHGDEDEEPLAQEPEHREPTTSARESARRRRRAGSAPPAGPRVTCRARSR